MRIRDCRIFIRHINADCNNIIAISVRLKQKDKKMHIEYEFQDDNHDSSCRN